MNINLQKHARPGFNFIEMLVALVIIGIIMGMVGPRVMGLLGRGRRTSVENTLKVIKTGIQQYQIDTGKFPETLQALIKRPENSSGWQGPYVGDENSANPEVPLDIWGQDFVYKLNERNAKPPFELYSLGDPSKEEDRIYAK